MGHYVYGKCLRHTNPPEKLAPHALQNMSYEAIFFSNFGCEHQS